jgi:hypothetical protein
MHHLLCGICFTGVGLARGDRRYGSAAPRARLGDRRDLAESTAIVMKLRRDVRRRPVDNNCNTLRSDAKNFGATRLNVRESK